MLVHLQISVFSCARFLRPSSAYCMHVYVDGYIGNYRFVPTCYIQCSQNVRMLKTSVHCRPHAGRDLCVFIERKLSLTWV